MSNLSPDHDKEQTSPLASLEARWPAEQACRNARRLRCLLELDNASLWPPGPGNLVCAHGTTILTNYESSELVGECIFYAVSTVPVPAPQFKRYSAGKSMYSYVSLVSAPSCIWQYKCVHKFAGTLDTAHLACPPG